MVICLRSLFGDFCSVYDVYCDVFTIGVVWEITPEVRTRKLVSPEARQHMGL